MGTSSRKVYITQPLLIVMRTKMSERTSPEDAMERIAWHLNYHEGEKVSLNQVSEATDLSWATIQKYTKALEVLNRISPELSVEEDGISVGKMSGNMGRLSDKKNVSVVVYVMLHAEIEGGVTKEISADEHADFFTKHEEEITELKRIGWLEETENGVKLTQKGIRIAGQAKSEVRNTDVSKDRPETGKVAVDEGGKVVEVSSEKVKYTLESDDSTGRRTEEKSTSGWNKKTTTTERAAAD